MRTKEEILEGMNLIDFLVRCKLDFKFFCERMLNLTEYGGIHSYQIEWFYTIQNNDRIMIEAPSGFSKTTIVGVAYPLWVIFNFNRKKILLVSKTLPQAKDNMLGQIRSYIEDNELLKDLMPKDASITWNQSQLTTTNGCTIINRPYSVNIKSYRADIIILDEIDSYEDTKIYFDYVISRLNPGGKIIGISTPENESRILALVKSRNLGDYVIKTYTAIINCKVKGDYSSGKSIWEEKFPISYLIKLKKEQGEQFFEKNYMCNIKVGSEDSIFKIDQIMKGYDKSRRFTNVHERPGSFVILACDFAISSGPRADFDAYVVIEKTDNFYIIKHIETWKGIPTPSKITRIEELIKEFEVNIVVADESNIGHDAIDGLLTKGYYVIPYKFTGGDYGERKKIIVTMKNVIDAGKLIIPRHPEDEEAINKTNELVTQLTGFIERKSEKTQHKLIDSTSIHDDIAMAVGMGIMEGTKQITENFFDFDEKNIKKDKIPSLINPFLPKN